MAKGKEGIILLVLGAILAVVATAIGLGAIDGSALILINPKPIAGAAIICLAIGALLQATRWNLK